MKTLPYDYSRCSGVIKFNDAIGDEQPVHDACHERDTCQRYLALVKWDKEADIQHYRGISVRMAVDDCDIKIEAGE